MIGRFRRRVPIPLVLVGALALSACGADLRDEQELRGFLAVSDRDTRSFTYTEAAADRWFRLEGAVEDDLRYRLSISSPDGPVVDIIVVDDAMAVRLTRPEIFHEIAAELGHPQTVAALMSGRWVVDPTAAPELAPRPGETEREAPDPVEMGVRLLRMVRTDMGQARRIRKFSLEDIEYKPSEDPWRHPNGIEEARYDLQRPILPTREDQMNQANVTIGEPHFRKRSVFVRQDRVLEICEMVDVEGHEEFVKLRERNIQNPFLDGMLEQVLEGRTVAPVRQRVSYATIDYPDEVEIALPPNALSARLDAFVQGLKEGLAEGGLIDPPGPVPDSCIRTAEGGSAG